MTQPERKPTSGREILAEQDSIKYSARYERWLNEAASTFKNPERPKQQIAFFMSELRREDDEPEVAPTDVQYSREFIDSMKTHVPLAINRIKVKVDSRLGSSNDAP